MVSSSSFEPSRLDLYAQERILEGTLHEDAGADPTDGIKVLVNRGVCSEGLYVYDTRNIYQTPPAAADQDAAKHKAVSTVEVDTSNPTSILHGVKSLIAAGKPVDIAFVVYPSFEDAARGVVPMPTRNEQPLGGHEILLVGYDDASRRVEFLNSWGTGWGDGGFGTLPYDFVTNANITSLFDCIETTTDSAPEPTPAPAPPTPAPVPPAPVPPPPTPPPAPRPPISPAACVNRFLADLSSCRGNLACLKAAAARLNSCLQTIPHA